MPDSVQKFQKIAKEYNETKKYTDDKFPADKSVLGENISPYVNGWKRASDAGLTLFGDGYTPLEPKQGSIGDCYLISSFSIASKKFVEGALMISESQTKNGAYIVRYFFSGEPVEIIVDDQFPVDSNGEWALCHSNTGKAIWPMILEKAYAKMHGGYDKIVAGKVSYALSEITDGYPEEIKLATAQQNPDVFWQTLTNYVEQVLKLILIYSRVTY
jgi:calpain, invertebrate